MPPVVHLPTFMQRTKMRAIFYMILSALCFSLLELVCLPLVSGITLYQVVWSRYALHLLLMIVVLGPRYKTKIVRTHHLSLQIVRSLTMVAMPVCAILATQHMPSEDMWSVYWLSPLIMLGLSVFIMREPAGPIRWVAALVGFVGMMLVLQPGPGIFSRALPLAIATGLAVSLHLMFSRILRDDNPLASLFHTALWVFVVMSFFVPVILVLPTLRAMFGVTVIAVVGLIALFALARSGELAPLPVVATFSYTEGIWRFFVNLLFFGLLPNSLALLGTLIIIVVTGYMLLHELRQPDTEPEVEPAIAFKKVLSPKV